LKNPPLSALAAAARACSVSAPASPSESVSYRDGTESVSGSVSMSVRSSGRSDRSAKPAILGQQHASANYPCTNCAV
jgi:hypothetical protein